ncbi:MAG: GNA1162 family protein [Thermodesulfobacteriota bacterium]
MTVGAAGAFLRIQLAVLAFFALLLASGCAGRKDVRPTPPPPVPAGPKVAVAPMENMSNDLSASDIVRDAFAEGVSGRGYAVVPVLESDRMLREKLGISYGGQLPTTTPEEVCKALGVEGVFYGEVLEFHKTTTGIYNAATVSASFRLYGKGGALLWEGKDRQVRQDVVRGGGGNLGAEIIARGLGNLLLNPMTPIARRVGTNIAWKLPGGLLDNTTR